MRKNGINRELRPIEGGVCAPDGYKVNAVSCGIKGDGLDFALLYSEKRCSVAGVFAGGNNVGATVKVSKRNIRCGYGQALLVNGGTANISSEKLALGVCDLLFPYGIDRSEVVVASTGYIGKPLRLSSFEKGIKSLWTGLGASHEHSLRAAQAIADEGKAEKQLSFAFDLGAYPCKIGAIFKGGPQLSPNMATFLAFLTTDVNISTPTLQRALSLEVKETFNMLNVDGTSSPNDTVCIFANGRAGNYKIDCADTEYKKFKLALRAVLTEICLETAREGAKTLLTCRVTGATSKEVARGIAKKLVGSETFKSSVVSRETDIDGLLFGVLAAANEVKAERIRLSLSSQAGEMVVYAEGARFDVVKAAQERILSEGEVEMTIDLQSGNYSALAFGRIS